MDKMKHSPLPWESKCVGTHDDEGNQVDMYDITNGAGEHPVASYVTKADAEFIVRACNSHGALVGALAELMETIPDLTDWADLCNLDDDDEDGLCDPDTPLCSSTCEMVGCMRLKLDDAREALKAARGEAA